jgi:hypothetical protein
MCGVFSSVFYGAEWKEKCPVQGLNGGDHGHAKSGASRVIRVYLRAASIIHKPYAQLRQGEIIIEQLETLESAKHIKVPDGLIHHWIAASFIPGVSLQQTLALLQDMIGGASRIVTAQRS